ncbi:SRPBCC family protein [Methylocystis suflitae]|uniref:SRPBCC family protein n=1 Tax=Methylocystis suflitae TaxID=2951405 RepID=UPI0021097A43|nr:SRPBCC domain-containing protein [Methylocystis suflitae]MCQ4191552.1 SRPBCC domain-containing protein [Methylocystis suflitae]
MLDATQTRSLTTEKDLEHPIEAVWRAMTDSEWLAVWFFPNDVEPVDGHKFTIWSRPIERWDGEFKCQVLAVEPGRMLRFSWSGGDDELKGFGRYIDTTVTWTISQLPNGGTHFVFTQDGIDAAPTADAVYDVMLKGSQSVLNSLAKRLPDLIEHGA